MSPNLRMVLAMTDTLSGRVAANLRAEIIRKGHTHESFATLVSNDDRASISRQAITNRLLGRTPISLDELDAYSKLLGIEPSKLLND